jgi:hypothetical protein
MEINMAGGLRQSISQSYKHLFELGFNPRNVIDVGVASGTFRFMKRSAIPSFCLSSL